MNSRTVILLLLSACYFFAYFDRLVITVVDEMIRDEFQLSDKELWVIKNAAFAIVYGVFGLPMGWVADHFNRKRIIAWFVGAWSGLTMACGLAGSYLQLAVARIGVGITEAPIVPVSVSVLADLYAPAKRSLAITIFYAGGMLGILACFTLGGAIAAEYGWRASFLIAGPPGILLALIIGLATREPERTPLPPGEPATRNSLALVWQNKPLVWQLVASASATFINFGIVTWLPNFFIRSHGLDVKQVGFLFGPVLAIGMFIGILIGGWIGNRLAARSMRLLLPFTTAVLLTSVPVFVVLLTVESLTLALAATFLGTALSVLYVGAQAAAWQAICHPRARGTTAGLVAIGSALIGGSLLPLAVGVLSDRWTAMYGKADGLRYALLAALSIVLLAAALFAQAARVYPRHIPGIDDGAPDTAR